jgi:hypothetical protein
MKDGRQCTATNKAGQQCRRAAILGGHVCRLHGGAAPQVKRKAAQRLADLIDPDRALREAAYLAYSDVREAFDEQGNLKPIKDWPDTLAAAVSGVEIVKKNLAAGDGQTDTVHKLKLWDKPKNLEMLFKHLGLLVERLEHSGGITISHELPE